MRLIATHAVVLYRKRDGSPVALSGICPHRAFALGGSCLRGDDIECGYHGMTFGPDGTSTRVPFNEETPQIYRLKSYPLKVQGDWLLIWMGDPTNT